MECQVRVCHVSVAPIRWECWDIGFQHPQIGQLPASSLFREPFSWVDGFETFAHLLTPISVITNDIRRRHTTSWKPKGWRLRVVKEVGSTRALLICSFEKAGLMFENKAVLITELHVISSWQNQQTYQCWILRNMFIFKDTRPKVIFFIRCSKFERSIVTRKITAQSHIRHRADLRRWKSEKGWQSGVSRAECFAWNPRSKMWFGGVAAL